MTHRSHPLALRASVFRSSYGWLVLLALAVCGIDAPPARAEEGETKLGYRVTIVAPRSMKDALESNLDLIRWQTYTDLTAGFLKLLIDDAKEQAREIASAQGYFSPVVTAEISTSESPPLVTLRVEPGEPTRVGAVSIAITGPAADEPAASAAVAALKSGWGLPQGAIFTQAEWDRAKAAAVRTVSAERYASAHLAASEAEIDPDTRVALLSVTIDSGPSFRFGDIDVKGLVKYPESLVRNLASFAPGDLYSQERLDQFIRRVNGTGYFASAQASVETDPSHADAAPVHIAVIEAPSKKLSLGIGFSTDTLYRTQFSYSNANIDGKALQLQSDLRLEGKLQSAALRLLPAPRVPGYSDGYDTKVERTDISGLRTSEFEIGWRRRTTDERNQTGYALRYYLSEQRPTNADNHTAHALYAEYAKTWRKTDDLLAPTRGWMLNAQLGAGPPAVSSEAFGRVILQGINWIPLDRKTQLSLRAEAGAVLAHNRQDIPTQLLFRVGGDTTVRGYAFQSSGPREGDATVGGRYYALGSAEVVRWIGDNWGVAVFVDAGNAADAVRDLRPVYGYGVGARVRTPIGPFRVDVAYGHAAQTSPHVSWLELLMRARTAALSLLSARAAPCAAVAGLIWLARSDSGLRWSVDQLVALSGGALTFEGVEGELSASMRGRRIVFTRDDKRVVASDVTIDWSPRALLSRSVHIERLSAATLEVELAPSNAPPSPPDSLSLPLQVAVDRADIGHLIVTSGGQRHEATALSFAYRGSAADHALTALSVVSEWGRVNGDVSLGAASPFPAQGRLLLLGDAALRNARLDALLSGDLMALGVQVAIDAEGAQAKGRLALTPFAATPWRGIAMEAASVDLARFDAALPKTALAISLDASPEPSGRIRGHVSARNAAPGALDRDRLPLQSLASQFVFADKEVELEQLAIDLGAAGRASGSGRFGAQRSAWQLKVMALDLRGVWSSLRATRLEGSIDARIAGEMQQVRGQLRDKALALAFDADVRPADVNVKSFRLTAGKGAVAGKGSMERGGAQALRAGCDAAGARSGCVRRLSRRVAVRRGEREGYAQTAMGCGDRGASRRSEPLAGRSADRAGADERDSAAGSRRGRARGRGSQSHSRHRRLWPARRRARLRARSAEPRGCREGDAGIPRRGQARVDGTDRRHA